MTNLDFFYNDRLPVVDDFNFGEVSDATLLYYRDYKSQSIDPYDVFKRLNDSYRLIRHENASNAYLSSFYELLATRLKSAISAANPSGEAHSKGEFNPFYDENNSASLSELILNLLQLERELKDRSIEVARHYTLEFDKKIRANDGWIEKSFLQDQNLKANTFFIPTMYEKVTSRPDYFTNRQRNSKFSGRILEEIFLKLEKGPFDKDNNTRQKISKALNRHSPDLFYGGEFETLIAIHHELAENTLSHAVNSRINHNSSSANSKNDFGILAYMQVQVFDYPLSLIHI